MDMVFRDDECRVRTDNAPANFATCRHIAYKAFSGRVDPCSGCYTTTKPSRRGKELRSVNCVRALHHYLYSPENALALRRVNAGYLARSDPALGSLVAPSTPPP